MGSAAAFTALLVLVTVCAAANQTRNATDEVVPPQGPANNTQDDSTGDDLEELSPRMMVDVEHEMDEYVPDEQVVGVPSPLYYRQAFPVYSPSGRLIGPHRHVHAYPHSGLVETAIVLPGAAPLSYGAGAPLMVEVPAGASRSPKGESGHLVIKLAMAAALRDNLVTVLGYLLHQPRWPASRDHYTALMMLFQAIRLRHVSVLDLLLVLKKASAETPSSQMLLFLRQLRRSSPRYLTSAIDEVISSVSSNRRTVDGIFQPDGGPLVVDFLAGIDSKYLPAAERPISMGKARIDAQVLALMGSTFAQIFSALWDGSLPLSQPLFGALLLHLPLSTLDPRADELSRMLVDILHRDAYENWSAVTASVKPLNKVQPFPLARRILKAMAKHSKTNDDIRDATLLVLHHLQEPERTFAHPHYNVLSPIVSKPNIDLVTVLQSITEPEYSEDVVDVKDRIVYYIQHGYLNLDLVTQGFMRYDHVKPIDLVIALLTRITTKMPKLPPEILKSVKSLIIHLAFKELSCNMAPSVPQNFVHLPSLTAAFLSPSLPLDIQHMSEKALKIIIHEYPEDINKLLPNIPVKLCIRPRKCLGTIMKKVLELSLLKSKPTLSTTEEFIKAIEQLTNDKIRRTILKLTTTAMHSSTIKQHPEKSHTSQFITVQGSDGSTTLKTTDYSISTLMGTPSTSTPSINLIPSVSSSLSDVKPTTGSATPPYTGMERTPVKPIQTASIVTVSHGFHGGHTTSGSTTLLPSTKVYVVSDTSSQSISENKLPKIEMGPDGKPVFPKGPTGKPMYPIGPKGKPVIFIGTDSKPIFPTGPDGNPIHPTGTDGKPVFVTGIDGKVVIPFTSDGRPVYPETPDKKPIVPTAPDGNPIFPTTPTGAPILPIQPDGEPIFPVNSDGMPIAPTAFDGEPLFTVGPDGKIFLKIGIDNAPIIPKGGDGAPVFVLGPNPVLGLVIGPDGNPYSMGIPATIYTITPNVEATGGPRVTVVNDISTKDKFSKIEMGPDGKPVFPKGPTGKPMYPIGPEGMPVIFIGTDGKPIFPTGPNGNPVHPTGSDGKPVFVTGLDGKVVIPYTFDGRPVYPETPDKKPIVPTAPDGNPIFPTTPSGAPILPVRPDGESIFPVKSDGMPIAPTGSDGEPLFTVGPDGRLFLKLGKDNAPIIPTGPDGALIFVLGPQPVLAIVLGPDGNPYSIGMPGAIYKTTTSFVPITGPKETEAGNLVEQPVQEANGKFMITKAPISATPPSLEALLASLNIQSLIPQVPKDVPLPELNPIDEQLPVIPDVTLDYLLPPTLPGTPEDLRLRPLRALLAMPEFTKLITTAIDLQKYKTRGELLRAVISYLLKLEELKSTQLLLEDLQFYLKRLQGADGKAPRLEVNWEGLLSALPIPSTTEEALHFKKIKEFLGPGLTQKLGTGFDSKAFKLKGALLKNLLQYAISLPFVMQVSGLPEAIRFYTNKVLMHGYGAQPVEYVIVKQTMMMKTVNLNTLFKAIDKSKFDTRARDAYKSMFKFFTTEFDAQKHFTGFDFTRFTSKGPWLKNFLEFLSGNEIVPPTRREDFKVLMAYVAMDGEGKNPVEYVN